MNTVEVSELTRQFVLRRTARGRRRRVREVLTAVDSMSFRIESGSAVGYIGANGAGKSTTIKMLTGILVPTSGTVRTCGLDPVRRRRELAGRIGVVFGQRSQLWWDLPLRESFTILAAIHRLEPAAARRRTDELVEQLEMAHTLDTPVRQLSLGQRMRAEIAAALLHRPELLILDEPTIGLDVLSKQRLREFLRRERADSGTTLLLTTHDMGDIERLCDRVLVVDHGRLAYDGTLPGLARTVGARRVLVVDLARPSDDLTDLAGATLLAAEADGMRQRLAFDPEITTAAQLLAAISNRVEVRDLSIEEPDIEDVVRRIYSAGDGTAPAPSDAGAVARGAIPGDEAESAAERPGEQGVQHAAEGGAAGVEKAVQRGATGVDDDRNHASTSL
ncbi:ATP-binding cassette domain-containing protein [Nocardia sp. NRRL WC-3656]|uniref:ABC transporter ATP-binding protein n=1 Tax=Nocardia sp. NRRL WC-3656 TaxID=1463824 RepID=UPI000B328211|nr:ATP-binding cassette domain-containing protein [Nocardia sp. NRRL WC-3656]